MIIKIDNIKYNINVINVKKKIQAFFFLLYYYFDMHIFNACFEALFLYYEKLALKALYSFIVIIIILRN